MIEIKFHTHHAALDGDRIAPSSKFFPDWFKSLSSEDNQSKSPTIKTCVPFKDAMSLGYTLPLWLDLKIDFKKCAYPLSENGIRLTQIPVAYEYSAEELLGHIINGMSVHSVEDLGSKFFVGTPEDASSIPLHEATSILSGHELKQVGEGCPFHRSGLLHSIYKLDTPWLIDTPRGWSCYVKPYPNDFFNHLKILEGVIDTDSYYANLNLPFTWTGPSSGSWVLKKGTPIAQIIPFKRTRTKASFGIVDWDRRDKVQWKLRNLFRHRYRDAFWHKGRDVK